MQDSTRVLAGDCTVTYDNGRTTTQRGEVVVLVKPDNTVLVHDDSGYQPAAWLTRPNSVQFERDTSGFALVATKNDERLRVDSHADYGSAHYPVTPAGPTVGRCPDCDSVLVRDGARVTCLGCRTAYALPRDATLTENTCEDCGLPTFRADRGDTFECCLDRTCESLDDAVIDAFDAEWSCRCGSILGIERRRALDAVCDDCDAVYRIPSGVVDGTCDCGLPAFDTPSGRRCLDATCDRNQ
ncbi:endonuclease NucS domain-containing protein [Salarchaeum japonicum]|uniref:Endonuclease NucS n=1 Tax=Salarchaeum japonicum TaxID=555573 RepID=A0AAV3T0G6_9EURY|nr:endonuclease NucS domain-containing protein [Salarchaeum japonicum]